MTITPDTAPSPPVRPIDPVQAAVDLWANLKEYQPAIAGALALHIRDFPVDWPQREFGIARPHALLTLQPPLRPGDNLMPEAAPYTPDIEECQACVEAGLICRWHAGQASAHEYWHNHVMAAIKADRDARVDDVLLHQEAEEEGVACRCRRCAPTKPAPARRSWWRRALKFLTHSLED
ncbi:hypothetical protein P1P75_33505 [Streptomyces sp. ID05-39B]|uniref:hypothetical protein n=1 Tax=Streptomyces sp. ID05-39B TaxID=3028664 RepID=UPI0029A5F447|nr:hypothetical protein [Streptomyces sp. ID05-39B]MDX3531191.1 hypothetical protein [Streptomyces sp. ID05-39B]